MATFDERAADWDTPDRIARAQEVADAIRRALPIAPGTRAIELGAGTGLLGLALVDRFDELVLADASAGMLEVAEAKVRERGLANVRTARLDLATDAPPAGAPFDLALSLLMLHHVKDTAAALDAVHRLLRRGGRIALVDLDTEDGSFHADAEGIHHHGFDRRELGRAVEAAGFLDVEFSTATTIEDDGRTYPLFLLTASRD